MLYWSWLSGDVFFVHIDLFQSDGGQIVGRLMQIRDYIKQAKAMMDALNKAGSQVTGTRASSGQPSNTTCEP